MDKIKIICYVMTTFTRKGGDVFFVKPGMIGAVVEAPEWITNTAMYNILMADGKIVMVNDVPILPEEKNETATGEEANQAQDDTGTVKSAAVQETEVAELRKKKRKKEAGAR